MKTALDSNVLSAFWSNESSASRIEEQLKKSHQLGSVVICAAVYAELTAHPLVERGFVDRFLSETGITIDFALDEAVWRRAAAGFASYAKRRRRSGGTPPKRLLADFIIAAHAILRADRLFTLDPSRYQQDFSELRII